MYALNHNILCLIISNIIKKANLNSDMQAVRQMNEALAEWEASNGYPDRNTLKIEDAMKIIADAGYDVDSWSPLTSGYQVYWFKKDNRCVLYNSSTKQVEFPAEYTSQDLTDVKNAGQFYVYNQTYKKAISQDLSFSSASSKNVQVGETTYSSALVSTSGDSVNYASAIVYQNDGDTDTETYRVAIKTVGNVTESDIQSARKAAGEYVYAIFQQLNEDIIDANEIIVDAGTVIDISDIKWKPLKTFTGYFGTTDAEQPIIIDGLTIDNTLSFSETFIAKGENNPIYLSGFIGALYGNATIENVTFRNIKIDHAASDRLSSSDGKDASNSAIIGGIVSYQDSLGNGTDTADVVIRNVKVENCEISAVRRAGGLVGYIGGTWWTSDNQVHGLKGTVSIQNCSVSGCTINSDGELNNQGAYAATGGIIGFVDKVYPGLTINVSKCSVSDTKLNGNIQMSNSVVGNWQGVQKGNAKNLTDQSGATMNVTEFTATNVTRKDNTSAPFVGWTKNVGTIKFNGSKVNNGGSTGNY